MVRNNPSERDSSCASGAGCGSISAHHAPITIHSSASGRATVRSVCVAAIPHTSAAALSATSRRCGLIQTKCATSTPHANSNAANSRGARSSPSARRARIPRPGMSGPFMRNRWKGNYIRTCAAALLFPGGMSAEKGRSSLRIRSHILMRLARADRAQVSPGRTKRKQVPARQSSPTAS